MTQYLKKPEWIRTRIPVGANVQKITSSTKHSGLATVCEEARCPNQWECWKNGTATFMLMGDTCTRHCRFCSVKTLKNPPSLNSNEPNDLAETIRSLKLKYAVLTTVDRDDLPDFGAMHIAGCVNEIKRINKNILIELLIPDFQGDLEALQKIATSHSEVIGHNLECTKSITPKVRDPRASYEQSLMVLRRIAEFNPNIITKSSLMLGLGETDDELIEAMEDIKQTGVSILTLGQYLQPSKNSLPVQRYVHPSRFEWFKEQGLKMGFEYVASGPLVRSSYLAAEHYLQLKLSRNN
ncbi:MAG: lipoyl synthase [Proteobacteria bacterium]|nr:lipoyl synthase [Pseudomonadota bacterium]